MKTLSKALVGTIAASAMAVSSVTPAFAQDRGDYRGGNSGERRGHDGISAGDIIAGALVIGGIAAVASATGGRDRDRDYGYDRAGYRNGGDYGRDHHHRDNGGGYGYDRDWRGNPRQAVERCVHTAESEAGRYSYGRADVTDIRSVRDTRDGYEVRGRIAVNQSGRGWRDGWGGDNRGNDSGSFTCRFERGQITRLDFGGLRGL
jgi:hypothetical protein